jgi:hypothetical protein
MFDKLNKRKGYQRLLVEDPDIASIIKYLEQINISLIVKIDRFCFILAKKRPINRRTSIDHFFADQFRFRKYIDIFLIFY